MADQTKIATFQPKKLESSTKGVQTFQPRTLSGETVNAKQNPANHFVSQNLNAGTSKFDLHPAARQSMGLDRNESNKIEALIQEQLEARLAEVKRAAYEEGFQQGMTDGKAQAEVEFIASVKPLYEQFEAFTKQYDQLKAELFAANEQFLVQLIFQFGKQVLLKELSADPEYIKRVSGLIVEKIGAKDHVKIKVSHQDYQNLEQIRDFLKAQFPDLKNIQIEPSDELILGGCKVETDLAKINASVETQLNSIQKSLSEA